MLLERLVSGQDLMLVAKTVPMSSFKASRRTEGAGYPNTNAAAAVFTVLSGITLFAVA